MYLKLLYNIVSQTNNIFLETPR